MSHFVIFLFFSSPLLPVSGMSHFVIFLFFSSPMQAVCRPPAESPLPTRFGRSGRLLPVSGMSHFVIFLFFSSSMQAVCRPQAESPLPTRFGRSGRLFFFVCPPMHTCTILFVCLSLLHASPPCPMFPNASFYFCYPPLF